MTPASHGLGRYYEHVLNSIAASEINGAIGKGPTEEELNSIEHEEYLEETEDYLTHWNVDDKLYH